MGWLIVMTRFIDDYIAVDIVETAIIDATKGGRIHRLTSAHVAGTIRDMWIADAIYRQQHGERERDLPAPRLDAVILSLVADLLKCVCSI